MSETLALNLQLQREQAEVYHLIEKWGVAYRREFSWHPSMGHEITVRSQFYPDEGQANQDARAQALELGYEQPKWWQWWRWNEHPLPTPPNKDMTNDPG